MTHGGSIYWPGTRIIKSNGSAFNWSGPSQVAASDPTFCHKKRGPKPSEALTTPVDYSHQGGYSRAGIDGGDSRLHREKGAA